MNVSRRRYMGEKGGSPSYQRIEYLEATGTQWINLGIYPNNGTRVLLVAEWLNNRSTSNPNPTIIGARNSSSTFYELLLGVFNANDARFVYQFGDDSNAKNMRMSSGRLKFNTVSNYLYINNSLEVVCVNSTFLTEQPLYLFALNNDGNTGRFATAKIFSLMIENNGNHYEFVPVRIGNTGYLYEVNSGQLFGNAGNSDFSLGPDITPIPYQEVEYLESNGNQYIDTNIVPDANTGMYVKASCNDSVDSYICGLRDTTGNTRWCVGHAARGYYYGYTGYLDTSIVNSDSVVELYLNYNNDKVFTVTSNSIVTVSLPNLTFTPLSNIRLFGSAGIVASYSKWNGKIYSFRITQGSIIVMDLVPVRVENVGYMYDKISGQLFGNNGTGSFTIGPDIN